MGSISCFISYILCQPEVKLAHLDPIIDLECLSSCLHIVYYEEKL